MTEPSKKLQRLRQFLRWLDHQMDTRPFFTAVVVMLLVVTPGFIRIEQNANTAQSAADSAHATALSVAAAEARDDARAKAEVIESCQTRNTFQQNTRDKFDRYNNAIETLLLANVTDPERIARTQAFVEQLRLSVQTAPEDEDADCNGDGEFSEADYLP